jgi:hypothetical protein
MKIIAVMGIEEHMPAIRKLLTTRGVAVFSEMDMTGMKYPQQLDERQNWFSHDENAVSSHLFFAIVDEQRADAVMTAVSDYSKSSRLENPIHAFILDVEKFI